MHVYLSIMFTYFNLKFYVTVVNRSKKGNKGAFNTAVGGDYFVCACMVRVTNRLD